MTILIIVFLVQPEEEKAKNKAAPWNEAIRYSLAQP
jgi:hypothetical protein